MGTKEPGSRLSPELAARLNRQGHNPVQAVHGTVHCTIDRQKLGMLQSIERAARGIHLLQQIASRIGCCVGVRCDPRLQGPTRGGWRNAIDHVTVSPLSQTLFHVIRRDLPKRMQRSRGAREIEGLMLEQRRPGAGGWKEDVFLRGCPVCPSLAVPDARWSQCRSRRRQLSLNGISQDRQGMAAREEKS